MDDRHHRLAVHPGERNRLLYLGWDVGSGTALDEAVEHLDRSGIAHEKGTDEECRDRHVQGLIRFQDVVGFSQELFYGQLSSDTFQPAPGRSGFVTGQQGMGHAVVVVPDLREADQFYTHHMGFRKSDEIYTFITLWFYHCNPRHHSLATVEMRGVRGLHHLMMQARELDDVGAAYDLCLQREIPLTMTLGRHPNDRMVSFYVQTPSGFDIEYGWGAIDVDDETWTVSTYDRPSVWGHKMVAQTPPGALEVAATS
jgi:extradiol dioxygenase